MEEQSILLQFGPLEVSASLLTSWGITLLIWVLCLLLTRGLRIEPGRLQTLLEGVVSAQQRAIALVVPGKEQRLLPFIGGLWIFLIFANLIGVIPGFSSPTADLSVTLALALLVFLSTHWYGLTSEGPRRYLKHYLKPSPVLLPFHLISEITRTLALAVRLFGNMMSLEMAALLVLLVAGFLVPVPILLLHIIEALVQAYIFGMLALIYVGGGIQSRHIKLRAQQEERS